MLTKESTDVNASLQQTSSLEQQQRLKIADLEQQLTQQEKELNITRSSHEQVPLLTKELADLNASLQHMSSLDQQQRLRIAELEQNVMRQDVELNVTRVHISRCLC